MLVWGVHEVYCLCGPERGRCDKTHVQQLLLGHPIRSVALKVCFVPRSLTLMVFVGREQDDREAGDSTSEVAEILLRLQENLQVNPRSRRYTTRTATGMQLPGVTTQC